MDRNKYQDTSDGRPYYEVRGYLRRTIDLPTVANELLTNSTAPIAAYSIDPSGDWRYTGEVTVHAYDESFSAQPLMYCRASLNDDNKLEVFWVGCSATILTLPTVRLTAVINRVDNTAAPPTTNTGDRYILDDTAGGVHADWGSSVADDVVEYDGSNWQATTPGHRYLVNLTTPAEDWIYSAISPVGWSAV